MKINAINSYSYANKNKINKTGITPDDFVRCSHTGIKKINIATATFDSVEHTVKSAYEKGEISGYYDLQGAEVEGAYQNAKKHILIFGTDNKA